MVVPRGVPTAAAISHQLPSLILDPFHSPAPQRTLLYQRTDHYCFPGASPARTNQPCWGSLHYSGLLKMPPFSYSCRVQSNAPSPRLSPDTWYGRSVRRTRALPVGSGEQAIPIIKYLTQPSTIPIPLDRSHRSRDAAKLSQARPAPHFHFLYTRKYRYIKVPTLLYEVTKGTYYPGMIMSYRTKKDSTRTYCCV